MNARLRPLGATLMMLLAATPLWADGPGGFTTEPLASDGVLYSVNQITGELITIDPNTAAIGVVGPTGFNFVEGLTYHAPSDSLLAVDNDSDQLIAINRHTGAGVAVGPIGHDFVFGLTYSEHDDTLYAVDTLANDLLTLDPGTGEASFFGPAVYDFVGGLTDNPETGTLYGVDYGNDRVFTVAFNDMGMIFIAPILDVPDTSMQGIAFDSTTGDLFAISEEVGPEDLLRIDPLTDAVGVVGQLESVSLASLAFVPHTVPEPAAGMLALLGLFAGATRTGRTR
ncbi:hypothetical protein MalM25_05170 [Planctomycetes bacterium MalM25]|nr:hypothetical protein MalM25_05170 [Planctomycetes bacterium MalM25]